MCDKLLKKYLIAITGNICVYKLIMHEKYNKVCYWLFIRGGLHTVYLNNHNFISHETTHWLKKVH